MPESVVDKAVAHAKKRIADGKSPFADAEPLTSPKGAVGIAQVMPGTAPEAAKLAGLEWDEYKYKNDPAYNKALGMAYFQKQLQDFGGNLAQTYAAYNAGPQAVRDYRDGTNVSGKNPKKITTPDGIPPFAETINYVNKNMREFAAGKGKAAAPTLAELKADLRDDPRLANNPSRLKAAETVLESEYKNMKDARKEADDKATDDILRELYANGGRLDAVPAAMRAALPGDKLSSVMNFADQVAKNGGATHSPEAWAAVLSLPREQLADMTPLDFYQQFRPMLDDAHLEKGYALIADAHGSASDKHLEIISVASRVKDAAIINGLLPEKGTPDKAQLQKFSQFERAVDDRVRRFEQTDLAGKRKANSQELQLIIDTMVLDTAKVPEWFTDPDIPVAVMTPDQLADAYVVVDGDEVKLTSIPTSQRAVIASKLQARGMPITEQRIAELWVAAGRPQ
ncbi:transglycosylase SLT domain-containing protein [Alcaligenaceae bacterium]|nr:transglycosylase SLT domain-containing protein [Alcaligenaceae bacterium]